MPPPMTTICILKRGFGRTRPTEAVGAGIIQIIVTDESNALGLDLALPVTPWLSRRL
jgi:hypothetical protein